MLDIKIGVPGQQSSIVAIGSMIQVHSDLLRALGGMYQQFKQHDPLLGGMFKDILLEVLNHPECPAWKDGIVCGEGTVVSVPITKKDGDGNG